MANRGRRISSGKIFQTTSDGFCVPCLLRIFFTRHSQQHFLLLKWFMIFGVGSIQVSLLRDCTTSLLRSNRVVTRYLSARAFLCCSVFLGFPSRLLIRLTRDRIKCFRPTTSRVYRAITNVRMVKGYAIERISTCAYPSFFGVPIRRLRRYRLHILTTLGSFLSYHHVRVNLSFRGKIRHKICDRRRLISFYISFRYLLALTIRATFPKVPRFKDTKRLTTRLHRHPIGNSTPRCQNFTQLIRSTLFGMRRCLRFFCFRALVFLITGLPILWTFFGVRGYSGRYGVSLFWVV